MNIKGDTSMNILEDIRSERRKKVILDTDTYNEIDDQFALSYLALSLQKAELLSVNAAPFFNDRSVSPEDGMLKSYNEIFRVLKLCKREDIPVFKGSTGWLDDENTPVESDAADNIIRTANSMEDGEILYVIAIGAITNVASALIKDRSIAGKIAVIWLGGHALHIGSTNEFNMIQDIAAARVVFKSGVELVMVPCKGMCTMLTTTVPELERWIDGKNELCTYLTANVRECFDDIFCKSRVIWDVAAVAVLLNPGALEIVETKRPEITYRGIYEEGNYGYMYYVVHLERDKVFADLFRTLLSLK